LPACIDALAAGILARHGQHLRNGQLGHGHRICARRIHHHNAPPRGRRRVNIVHADARPANHAQLWRMAHQRIIDLHRAAHHQRIGVAQRRRQSVRQLVVGQNFPSRLGREHGERCRRNLFRQNNLHRVSLVLACSFILVKADAVLFAQNLEHPQHRRVRLALAPFIFGQRVGMNPQPLGHLVLIEAKLLACNQQLLPKTQFSHEIQLPDDSETVVSGPLRNSRHCSLLTETVPHAYCLLLAHVSQLAASAYTCCAAATACP
jgi:hypothetical protein